MDIRYGEDADHAYLLNHDHHVDPDWIRRCILDRQYILATEGPQKAGFLRFSMFWGKIPYMDLVWVSESYRRQGVGSGMFHFWEQEMKKRGATILMTSSMHDEPEPQEWHRRNGFRPSGQLTFGKLQEPPEVFFVLDLV
jgi:GNAT superfamily N-acetyltransferase